MQPAHLVKHIPLLHLPFRSSQFSLRQLDNGQHNGTAIWLSGQTLALILPVLVSSKANGKRKRAIELGSGTGFTALALCSLGWDIIATDTRAVLSSVLQNNIDANKANLPSGSGIIETRELDWTVEPENWTWSHPSIIASHDHRRESDSESLSPLFDLILTADTIYKTELIVPLMRSLHVLSTTSNPPIYLALERRDPILIDNALQLAQGMWSFSAQRVSCKKISKAMLKAGCKWDKGEWEGVEIWRLVLHHPIVLEATIS
ncbi:hypothetical protein BU17DRAFT_44747 [Hysterangium stoloniferum]|nr:hypothetical protein BU17DRAFT_44747 [Hysterangium stoloniferum]